jgi:hypothetical protein
MTIKKTCETCGIKFDAKRADTMYCSNACKQKGYQTKQTQKNEVNTKPVFSFGQYQEICELRNWDYGDVSFEEFCFRTLNAPKGMSIAELNEYLGSLNYDFLRSETKARKDFFEKYHSGCFEIVK